MIAAFRARFDELMQEMLDALVQVDEMNAQTMAAAAGYRAP